MCDRTTVYGFGTSSTNGNGHYYGFAIALLKQCVDFCFDYYNFVICYFVILSRAQQRRLVCCRNCVGESRSQLHSRVCIDQSPGTRVAALQSARSRFGACGCLHVLECLVFNVFLRSVYCRTCDAVVCRSSCATSSRSRRRATRRR